MPVYLYQVPDTDAAGQVLIIIDSYKKKWNMESGILIKSRHPAV
jgi:hypothetical protein